MIGRSFNDVSDLTNKIHPCKGPPPALVQLHIDRLPEWTYSTGRWGVVVCVVSDSPWGRPAGPGPVCAAGCLAACASTRPHTRTPGSRGPWAHRWTRSGRPQASPGSSRSTGSATAGKSGITTETHPSASYWAVNLFQAGVSRAEPVGPPKRGESCQGPLTGPPKRGESCQGPEGVKVKVSPVREQPRDLLLWF